MRAAAWRSTCTAAINTESAAALEGSWIAEQLAGPGWVVCPEFLDTAAVRALATESRAQWEEGQFRAARIGIGDSLQLRPEIRSDYVHWLDENALSPAQQGYFAAIDALRRQLNQQLYLGLFGFEAHLAVYPPGASYRRHLDQFRGAAHRQVSCILYLNTDWGPEDGGQLRLYPADQPAGVDVQPRAGTLACFLSADIEHEVLPARRERFSLTGWLRTRA